MTPDNAQGELHVMYALGSRVLPFSSLTLRGLSPEKGKDKAKMVSWAPT